MKMQPWRALLFALSLFALAFAPTGALHAQSQPSAHRIALSNFTQSVDSKGRVLLTGTAKGDVQGILSLALVVAPDGTVTGGEWSLNVSYIVFGAPDKDGDGDESESLVQVGMLKGTIGGGAAPRRSTGLAYAVDGIALKLTGATVKFANVTGGSGTFAGSSLDTQTASNGTLTLIF